jgi:hypothetical protein
MGFRADGESPHNGARNRRETSQDSPSHHSPGIRSLMLAVLEEAIATYLGAKGRLADEAEVWMLKDEDESPFSFRQICDVLHLDPSAVRKKLRQWRTHENPGRDVVGRPRGQVRKTKRLG